MLEGVLNEIFNFGGQILQVLQQINQWIVQNFGGFLILAGAVAAIAAWRNSKKGKESRDVLQKLAEAIMRQHNKELREGK